MRRSGERSWDILKSMATPSCPARRLIPESTDKTVLLVSAGVQQMLPFFNDLATPPRPRLASIQKCMRTTPADFEEVGDYEHQSFFEMMGNFSVHDYFKADAVRFSWELCTQRLTFDPQRIWATIYPGDTETRDAWIAVGLPEQRIVELPDNWWGPAGAFGPCGPDSEMFYDRGEEFGCGRPDCKPGCDYCSRFLEFWNNVFTDHWQDPDGTRKLRDKKDIDTGAGLERWSMLLQGVASNYETDLLRPIIESIADTRGCHGGPDAGDRARVAHHHRSCAGQRLSCWRDGVLPSKEGRGYVLRRLLRRAVRYGRLIGLTQTVHRSSRPGCRARDGRRLSRAAGALGAD